MRIDEVLRSCAIAPVAEAAVASVGGTFAANIGHTASVNGMTVGEYAVTCVGRFAKAGREREMRAVASAMLGSPAPVLAALEQILAFDAEVTLCSQPAVQ